MHNTEIENDTNRKYRAWSKNTKRFKNVHISLVPDPWADEVRALAAF